MAIISIDYPQDELEAELGNTIQVQSEVADRWRSC